MIYQFLCFFTHTKLARHVAITGILCFNSIIDKQQKEQNNLDFQVGNKQVLLALYRALSDFYISLLRTMNFKLIPLLMSLSFPLLAVEIELTEEKTYCLRWADRFLSIKDGQNYRENKISAAKFPMYIDLCLENYVELRNMYKQKKLGKPFNK